MKNRILITLLLMSIVVTGMGVLIKINGNKPFGDILLVTGSIAWIAVVVMFVYRTLSLNSKTEEKAKI